MSVKAVCPSCGRTVQVLNAGGVRNHKPAPGSDVKPSAAGWCPGGVPERTATTVGVGELDNVRPFRAPDRSRKASKLDADGKAAANAARPPSKALDRREFGVCGAPLIPGDRRGDLCQQASGAGTDHVGFGHCRKHGGSTPNGKKYAAVLRARGEAQKLRDAQTFYGVRVAVDPEQALLEELHRSNAVVRYLERRLAEWGTADVRAAELTALDPNATPDELDRAVALLQGLLEHRRGVNDDTGLPELLAVYRGDHGATVTDTEYAAYQKVYLAERKHLTAVAAACIAGNIAERRQSVLEARASMIRELVGEALRLAGVTMPESEQLPLIAQATRIVAKGITA